MPRYIETESFEKSVRERYCKPCQQDGRDYHGVKCRACEIDDMLCEVADAPTAKVDEVKHGKWVVSGTFDDFLKCSICGFDSPMFTAIEYNYCPICGAKMNVEDSKEKIDDTESKASV